MFISVSFCLDTETFENIVKMRNERHASFQYLLLMKRENYKEIISKAAVL